MDNDGARHELTEALALVQEHMADLAIVTKKRAALSATATAADGTVVVTVNAEGIVSETAVEEAYFEGHDVVELGRFITSAAQAAAGDLQRQTAELFAPLAERRARFPSLADVVDGAPDIRNLVPHVHDQTQHFAGNGDHDGDDTGFYPNVRS
ncbi:YbaB/EbfC family nucleoid-associated protein [Mycobacterium sp.]|uniref:YbaB/EbfC family nucleoid-associated protein n=1 Tax=Mycobacterium sp. TaxID=1785 RepID=UPI002D9B1864|nr:YbaB/EbfC family nucleoid-associated protein [Mycobacterium sp.]